MSSKKKMTVRGTIAELVGKVTVNGKHVGQAELSVLTRLGEGTFATAVEKIPQKDANGKHSRGRPTNVWEIDANIRMHLDDSAPMQPQAGGEAEQPQAGGEAEQPQEQAAA